MWCEYDVVCVDRIFSMNSYERYHQQLQIEAATVTREDRKKHGIRSGVHKDKYPIANKVQAINAINKRHNAKPKLTRHELSNLLTRAAKYAPEAAKAAREKDRQDGRL